MIHIKDLSMYQGATRLLDHTSVQLHDGWKIALIGANGCGKSSFFSLLLNGLTADSGECSIPSVWRVSHMAQEISDSHRSALDYVLDGHTEYRRLEAVIHDETQNPQTLSRALAAFDDIRGYECPSQAERLLSGLGFQPQQFNNPVNSFSGGWRIRLNLARALMVPSDLLLLDEPTNHLDMEACIWLEKWLNAYQGTLLFVSHDKEFINNVADHIVSFEAQTLQLYNGNYDTYEITKAQRLLQQQSAYEKQQQRIQEIQSFVTRFKAKASKARQAQSRVKELERMELIAPAHMDSPFNFHFREADKTSDPLIRIDNLNIGYQDTPILENINLMISPGDRIGLLGVNGAGKSTLIKFLAHEIRKISGDEYRGQNLAVGYFAQHQLEALRADDSPLSHFRRLAPDTHQQELKNYLGGFGFQGDKVDARIANFSGGEKARLSLATVSWYRPNLLLLDEPTNHLDLEMRHALTMALQSFEGAVVLISHDRYLLRNTVDQFWVVANGRVTSFDNELEDYYRNQSGTPKNEVVTETKTENKSAADAQARKRREAEIRRQLSPIKKQIEKTEQQLNQYQQQNSELERQLADSELYSDERKATLIELLEQKKSLDSNIEALEQTWLSLHDELETLQQDLTKDQA
ncbi:ATP-binding cassette domain-containing protein [Gynuella sp.]|uniref:ATP-binding cassette domain-containing protein n=1 Tax=Gynuella sp. TaxID=2969146 RepID=UPI003D106D51